MASNYHGLLFLGFSACIPQGIIPNWLYYPIFCPNAPADKEGRMFHANYGMRKIEATLLANGFSREDIIIAHPDHIHKVVDSDTKILSISSNDPLGIGPATSTFVELWGGEGRMAVKLRELLSNKAIQKHRPSIFLGGPGSWQLSVHPEKQKELGIDCVVVGEGDVTAPKLFKKALEKGINSIEHVINGEVALDNDIANIVGGSTIGLVEITRGCARNCAFCVPTLKKVRSRPIENILAEVQVNIDSGEDGALLHGEDILLYKSDGLKVNADGIAELFDRVYNAPGVNWVGASHASFSSAASCPEAVKSISTILELGTPKHPCNYFQVGIETGSPKLIKRHMNGKVYPYQAEEWPNVVKEGAKVFHDNHIIFSGTVIMGLPGEEPEDIEMTTELIKSLKPYCSIVVPLLFTPMETTRLEYATALRKTDLLPQHHELLTAAWDHNLDWLPTIWGHYGRNSNYFLRKIIDLSMKFGTKPLRKKMYKNAKKHGANLYYEKNAFNTNNSRI